jgi:hypothetical protein
MPSTLQRRVQRAPAATLLAGCTVALAAYASIQGPEPTWLSPYGFASFMSALFISEKVHHSLGYATTSYVVIHTLAALPLAIIFWIWSYPLFRGGMRIPWRSKLLYICVVAASACTAYGDWHNGVKYNGLVHTCVMFSYNTLAALALGALWYRSRRGESFALSLAFQAGLFLWLAWSALAWLGD